MRDDGEELSSATHPTGNPFTLPPYGDDAPLRYPIRFTSRVPSGYDMLRDASGIPFTLRVLRGYDAPYGDEVLREGRCPLRGRCPLWERSVLIRYCIFSTILLY